MNLIKCTVLMLSFLCFSNAVNAQITVINAKVTDSKGSPLEGNFLLKDTLGNQLRSAGFSGTIRLEGLNHQQLRLSLRSVLFADTTISISYSGSPLVDIGTIIPNENQQSVQQVEIRAVVPMIRYSSNGNLQVNVAGTILATSSSVSEILSRTPGINVSEGTISVQGKGEAIIYLNGILITAERLSSIPVSQISKVELITSPSARYDASGRAVIHITTKAPGGAGLNGRISQYITHGDFFSTNYNSFADLGYTKGKLSLSGNIALQAGKGRELLYTLRERPYNADYLRSELRTDWKRDFDPYLSYGFTSRFNFSPQSTFSFSYSGNRDQLGGTVNSENNIRTMAAANTYNSSIAKDELRQNNIFLIDFTKETDTLGSNIFIGGQHSRYSTGNDDLITETNALTSIYPPRFLQNTAIHKLHITSAQADRTKIFNAKSKLEFGLRFSTVGNSSDNKFFVAPKKEGPYTLSDQLSSDFSYKETIGAGYGSFTAGFGKLSATLGLRAEWTKYQLETNVSGIDEIKNDYLSVFPNLSFQLPVQNIKWNASYASRITRPRYQALNPFVIYQDPFTTIEGNPALKPEKSHAVEISADYKGTVLKLGYTYTIDQLSASALRGSTPESYVLKSINISSDYAYLLSLTRPFTIGKWWQSINTANLTYGKSIDDQHGFTPQRTRPQIYLYSSNSFSIPHNIKLQLLAWYLGDRYYSLRHDTKRSMVTLGIEKAMLKNNLKLGLTANDIFNKNIAEGDYNVGQAEIYYNRRYGNKYLRVTASYNFGGAQQSKQLRRPAQTENNRAN